MAASVLRIVLLREAVRADTPGARVLWAAVFFRACCVCSAAREHEQKMGDLTRRLSEQEQSAHALVMSYQVRSAPVSRAGCTCAAPGAPRDTVIVHDILCHHHLVVRQKLAVRSRAKVKSVTFICLE